MSERQSIGFIFAGGGTGGHIYPALAIIEQLHAIDAQVGVHILSSNRAVDAEILNKEQVPFSAIVAMPISKKPKGMLRFVRSWRPSIRQTQQQIHVFQAKYDRVVLVAMGGFVAGPAARAANEMGVSVVLVNLDAVPGKANRLIAKKAQTIYTAAAIQGYPSWAQINPIVRNQMSETINQAQARESFGLDGETKTLLITGGSQGATSINAFVRTLVDEHPDAFEGWQIIHQVGEKVADAELEAYRDLCAQRGVKAWIHRYIDEMGTALSSADCVMARCGAGTVAECWAARVPAVFFPYPYHADEHQKHNAKPMADARCAIVLDDHVDPVTNDERHGQTIIELLTSDDQENQLGAMGHGFDELGKPDGAGMMARALMDM